MNKLYELWDCCLVSDMLSDRGNTFARAYFDFESGAYLKDYAKHLQKELPSEFHVPYTAANEEAIHHVISKRFEAWSKGQK